MHYCHCQRTAARLHSPLQNQPKDFLHLADVYQLIFDRKPSYSPDGPFVRFVEATLRELEITNDGKTYSRASISKARKDDESGSTRRDPALARRDGYRRWRQRLLIQACVGHREYESGEPSESL